MRIWKYPAPNKKTITMSDIQLKRQESMTHNEEKKEKNQSNRKQ